MSTEGKIRYERDDASDAGFYIYEELFDEEHVYLALEGFHFEASSIPDLIFDKIHARPRVTVKFPIDWARKLKATE